MNTRSYLSSPSRSLRIETYGLQRARRWALVWMSLGGGILVCCSTRRPALAAFLAVLTVVIALHRWQRETPHSMLAGVASIINRFIGYGLGWTAVALFVCFVSFGGVPGIVWYLANSLLSGQRLIAADAVVGIGAIISGLTALRIRRRW